MQSSDASAPGPHIRVGKRMTQARRDIIACFMEEAAPLAIADVCARVTANEASVYRTIHALVREGFLAALHYPDGSHRYELISHHHHHLICTQCGHTVHLPCTKREPIPPEVHAFGVITHHEVTYYGTCTTCG